MEPFGVLTDTTIEYPKIEQGKINYTIHAIDSTSIQTLADYVNIANLHGLKHLWIMPHTGISDKFSSYDDSFVVHPAFDVFPSELTAFMKISRKGVRNSNLCLSIPEYNERFRDVVEITSAKTLNAVLFYIQALTGDMLRFNCGWYGLNMLKRVNTYGERKNYLAYPTNNLDIFYDHRATEIHWSRDLNEDEKCKKYVIGLDINNAFLRTFKDVHVGSGDYSYECNRVFDRKIPGLWNIQLHGTSVYDGIQLPHPLGFEDTCVEGFYDTNAVQSAILCGYTVEVKEAVIFTNNHTTLKPYYDILEQALQAIQTKTTIYKDELARKITRKLLKRMYSELVGTVGHEPVENEKIHWYSRPDIRNAVVNASNNRVFWYITKYNLHPIAINVDDIFFVSDTLEPLLNLPMSKKVGDFSVKYCYPMQDVQAYFVRGNGELMHELSNYRKEHGED